MAKSTAPVLDLDTLIKRPIIIIGGVRYEILNPDELSVVDHHRLTTQGQRLDALMSDEEMDETTEQEVSQLLVEITDWIMVGVPPEVRAKLSDAQRMDIGSVFTALPLRKHLMSIMEEAGVKPGKMPIGGRRSRISRGSTAGPHSRGLESILSWLSGRM